MMFYDAHSVKKGFNQLGGDALERVQATHEFSRVLSRGRRKGMQARLRGRSRQLLNLNEIAQGNLREQRYGGTQTVPLEQIRGSEGRVREFDIEFNPVEEHIEQRWVGIAAAHMKGLRLPPVELLQVGDTYFVRDGHHRISVARAYGQCEIDAVVTVIETKQ
ncbi:MAG: hypothetical protein SF029_24020 [bacterium]|nr:hypothetical protein [bacterium]